MGNQLTGIAPSQILPVEYYLTDVTEHEFEVRYMSAASVYGAVLL